MRVVDRLVVPVVPGAPFVRQAPQVPRGELRLDHRREGGRVGGHHQLVGEAAFEAEARNTEGLVLVVAVAIDEVVGAFGDPPRHVPLRGVLGLAAHGHAAGLVEERPGVALHQQQRHQVLEGGAAPRQERRPAVDTRDQATQVKPVRLGQLPARDGDEAGEPRLRGQQVVVGVVEAARSLGVRQAEADREDPALRVVEEAEAHAVGEGRGA